MLPHLSINNALKLISSVTNQINSGKSQIIDIEADERFIHLRKIVKIGNEITTTNDYLSQYTQLSTPTMIEVNRIFILVLHVHIYMLIYSFYIKVIASLGKKGNRHTPLLRMLSYNIVKYNTTLTMKQSATLLYSMAILNFPDKVYIYLFIILIYKKNIY